MSVGEWLSRGINKQVGQQPESIKNAASRWVDRTFGKADGSIVAFVQGGVEPESPQAKVDLADKIAHTPNYLLEKVVDSRRMQNESQDDARGRVTAQVARLFDALDSATIAHTEDVRSEVAQNLAKKPQNVFDRLVKRSLRFDSTNIAPKLRLSAGLIDSGIVETHNLVFNGSETLTSVGLKEAVLKNAEIRTAKIIKRVMEKMTVAPANEAEAGIDKFVDVQELAKKVVGPEFILTGTDAATVILKKIEPSIKAEMSKTTVHPSTEAEFGIEKFSKIKTKLKQEMGQEMPEGAVQAVIDKIEPSIKAEMSKTTVHPSAEPEAGRKKALKIENKGLQVFGDKPEIIDKIRNIVMPYQLANGAI